MGIATISMNRVATLTTNKGGSTKVSSFRYRDLDGRLEGITSLDVKFCVADEARRTKQLSKAGFAVAVVSRSGSQPHDIVLATATRD